MEGLSTFAVRFSAKIRPEASRRGSRSTPQTVTLERVSIKASSNPIKVFMADILFEPSTGYLYNLPLQRDASYKKILGRLLDLTPREGGNMKDGREAL
jgi:hypothetical protein